jgi:hypothetical protein
LIISARIFWTLQNRTLLCASSAEFHPRFDQVGGVDAEEFVEFSLLGFGSAGLAKVVNPTVFTGNDQGGVAMSA